MKAILFPGQGSQFVGMGSDFYEKFDLVKDIFETVDRTLGFKLSNIILNGPEEKLKLTENAQPAIMTVGVSIYTVLNEKFNLNLGDAKFFAGHSLGEYTALVCSGSLNLEQAAFLLHERGKAMQVAVPKGEGAMIAILGMNLSEVESEIIQLESTQVCEIANDNSNEQVVVSGNKDIIDTLRTNLKLKKKRGIILPVSAPFHCSLMNEAAETMKKKIQNIDFKKPNPSIISNVTAQPENKENSIKSLLVDQITSRVRWRESVNYMIGEKINEFIEIGPGRVLSGLIKKIDRTVNVKNFSYLTDITND
jgi:[acyl-carrier-protein] S-malonyltransferase